MSATATGGVRNLRAIFENKSGSDQSNSPPSRGRSSSGSVTSASSRPVSSVRTSFVAVDTPAALSQTPQGQLRRASDVSRMAGVREESSNAAAAAASDAVLTSPHQTTHPVEGGLGTILKGSSFEGTPEKETRPQPEMNGIASRAAAMVERIKSTDKPGPPPTVHLNTTPTAQPVKPPHPKYVSPYRVVATPSTPTSTPGNKLHIRGGPAKILGVMESAKVAREVREAARQEQTNKSPVTTDPQPQPESQPEPQPGTKAPLRRLPLRGGPAKILSVMESAKEAREAREAARQEQTNKSPTATDPQPSAKAPSRKLPSAATATTAARDGRKAAAIEPTQKPAPRSRLSVPAKLPSAATAKTAASTAKSEMEPSNKVRSSTSRASLASRSTKVPSTATAVTASTLAKKTSRASLLNGDHAKSRPSTARPDESFLARMSRPTVSSASKTHDKVEAKSPPRGGKAKAIPRTSQASSKSRRSDQSEATISEQNDHAVDEPAATNGISNSAVEAAPTSNGDGVTSATAPSAPADPAVET